MSLRCLNCRLRLDRIKRHRLSDETEQILERAKRWAYPRDLTDAEYLCHACWEIITQDSKQPPIAVMGHSNVCVVCGRSILRVRSRTVLRTEMSKRETLVSCTIAQWIQPREIKPFDEVCIPCWLKAQRATDKDRQNNQADSVQAGPSNIETSEAPSPLPPEPPSQEVAIPEGPQIEVEPNIVLPTIRRAAATARRCLFLQCNEQDKLLVPEVIRRRVLADFNFYIPTIARICEYHLNSNLFRDLYAADNSMTTFTASQVEDMVFLLREVKQIDFRHVEDLDDNLFMYWFGRKKHEYKEIIAQVPRLHDLKNKLGLNALLFKMRTGDSDERISSLFQIPRRTLEGYMKQARKILVEDVAPQNLDFAHMLREE